MRASRRRWPNLVTVGNPVAGCELIHLLPSKWKPLIKLTFVVLCGAVAAPCNPQSAQEGQMFGRGAGLLWSVALRTVLTLWPYAADSREPCQGRKAAALSGPHLGAVGFTGAELQTV